MAGKTKNKAAPKPQRVEVRDKQGNVARPYEKDIDAWLAKGWVRVNSQTEKDTGK